jgi:hypothetical protein
LDDFWGSPTSYQQIFVFAMPGASTLSLQSAVSIGEWLEVILIFRMANILKH